MANMEKIADKLAILPAQPGCYLMKNKGGDIIYVGKAKVLKNRVRQYFVGAHDFKTTRLVANSSASGLTRLLPGAARFLFRDGVLQGLTRLKDRHLGGRDLDALLGLGITADALGALLHLKSAEPYQLHLVIVGQTFHNCLDSGIDRALRVLLG